MKSLNHAFAQFQNFYQNDIYESEVPGPANKSNQSVMRNTIRTDQNSLRRPSQPNQLPQIQQRKNQPSQEPVKANTNLLRPSNKIVNTNQTTPAKNTAKTNPVSLKTYTAPANRTLRTADTPLKQKEESKLASPARNTIKTNNPIPSQNFMRPVNTVEPQQHRQQTLTKLTEGPIEEEKLGSFNESSTFAFDGDLRISTIKAVKKDNLEFYNQIQLALQRTKELYEDETFRPIPSTISTQEEHSYVSQTVTWVRVPEVYSHKAITVCGENIGPDDIIQGQLGNCFFLSAVSALAEQKQYVQRLFHSKGVSSTGCYSLWFCDSGEWKNILIDDYIPCSISAGGTGYIPKFSKSHGDDIWVLLLEKAYAKLYGSYYNTSTGYQGEALSALTGAPVKYFTPKKNGIKALDQLWLFLLGSLENKFVLTVSSRKENGDLNNREMGLISTHAYAILDANEVDLPGNRGQRIIKMRNPWGNVEWTGAWSDSSSAWTEQLKKKLNYEPKISDGVFWISLEDFNKHFFQPCVCKVHSNFGYSFLKLGENKKQNVFVTKMKVKSSGFGYITVQQRRRKHFQHKPGYDYSYVRVIIAKTDENGQILSIVHGKYKNFQSINIKRHFDSGNYLVLMEVDWIQTYHREIVLSAYSGVEIEFQEQPLSNYNIPSLYEKIIRTYIFTAGDPKIEGTQMKISGKERQAWKYPFPTKFGLGALLLINKESSDLHYKVQIESFINMEIYIPASRMQSSLVNIIVAPGKEAMFVLKAKINKVDAIKNSYGYRCREAFAFAQQAENTPAKKGGKTLLPKKH